MQFRHEAEEARENDRRRKSEREGREEKEQRDRESKCRVELHGSKCVSALSSKLHTSPHLRVQREKVSEGV